MIHILATTIIIFLVSCCSVSEAQDKALDAPECRAAARTLIRNASSYEEALNAWRSIEDLNTWIGNNFEYDRSRAMLLSETQRNHAKRTPIYEPHAFFKKPRGVYVDLARFAVETLQSIDPHSEPAYLMIEFAPVTLNGNTLRRHWIATFKRNGQRFFFADSKRPGYIAGPYARTDDFIQDYTIYRGREIVLFKILKSYERKQRKRTFKQIRMKSP